MYDILYTIHIYIENNMTRTTCNYIIFFHKVYVICIDFLFIFVLLLIGISYLSKCHSISLLALLPFYIFLDFSVYISVVDIVCLDSLVILDPSLVEISKYCW